MWGSRRSPIIAKNRIIQQTREARSVRQLYKYRENSDNSTDKGGSLRSPINIGKIRIIQQTREARSARQLYILENATSLGSRIPPHAVMLQVNDNTPVKLKIIFAI